MNATAADEAAFPRHSQEGMTMREWYASIAMHGLVMGSRASSVEWAKQAATQAFVVADAMLAEAAKKSG